MTQDRALELAEAALHESRRTSPTRGDEYAEALEVIGRMRETYRKLESWMALPKSARFGRVYARDPIEAAMERREDAVRSRRRIA